MGVAVGVAGAVGVGMGVTGVGVAEGAAEGLVRLSGSRDARARSREVPSDVDE
ncbi:hypothetical protein G7085_13930 [Tessaracoccus sp. HDW20]|nr:hypothetical protein [Tessaracoccus coleopterorum]